MSALSVMYVSASSKVTGSIFEIPSQSICGVIGTCIAMPRCKRKGKIASTYSNSTIWIMIRDFCLRRRAIANARLADTSCGADE